MYVKHDKFEPLRAIDQLVDRGRKWSQMLCFSSSKLILGSDLTKKMQFLEKSPATSSDITNQSMWNLIDWRLEQVIQI